MFDDPFNDGIEDLLLDRRPRKAPPTVLRQRRGIRYLVGQAQAKKPTIGHIDLDFPHQLAIRTDPEQVANEQHFEQPHRVEGQTAVVGTIQMGRLLADEVKPDVPIDQTQQMI